MGIAIDPTSKQMEPSLLLGKPYFSNSVLETLSAGSSFAKRLKPHDIVACSGDLGAGKTHFIKGIASHFSFDPTEVNSPTFVYVNQYEGPALCLYHFDLYRLTKAQDFYSMGLDEYFFQNGICLIEWPSIIVTALPSNTYFVHLEVLDETTRKILITHKP